jgi:8-oxo-dGTP diphosphatase
MKPYCYDYPHPAVTTDIALFTIRDERLAVLLIRRGADPFKDCWALPGGFVEPNECLEDGALRELAEETGVTARTHH